MRDRLMFPVPESRANWCLVYAFAHAAGMTTQSEVDELARRASKMWVGVLSFLDHRSLYKRPAFNTYTGMGHTGGTEGLRAWAALIDKGIAAHQHYHQSASPTVAQFVRANPKGTHMVVFGTFFRAVGGRNYAAGRHVLCVIDGAVYGQRINMRKHIVESFTVTQETQL